VYGQSAGGWHHLTDSEISRMQQENTSRIMWWKSEYHREITKIVGSNPRSDRRTSLELVFGNGPKTRQTF
jgi:hypothetical protein